MAKASVSVKQRILFEDNHIIVVNKLPGENVQSDESGDEPLLESVKQYIKEAYNKPGNVFLGLPHRLDRPTSGLVIFAKTEKALSRLGNMFRDRQISKFYWAIVDTLPPEAEGTLSHHLVRKPSQNKSYAHDTPKKNSQPAELRYKILGASKSFYLLEIELITGRHHQIRAQLAKVGCHIKGDLKYGSPRSNRDGGIHLHARRVEFVHPVSKEQLVLVAPPPKDQIWDMFKNL